MVNWKECLDTFVFGVAIGLAISIIIAVPVVEINVHEFRKQEQLYQEQIDKEFERQRLEAEGWVED